MWGKIMADTREELQENVDILNIKLNQAILTLTDLTRETLDILENLETAEEKNSYELSEVSFFRLQGTMDKQIKPFLRNIVNQSRIVMKSYHEICEVMQNVLAKLNDWEEPQEWKDGECRRKKQ